MATWRKMLIECMAQDDSFENVEAMYPPNLNLDREFYAGFGGAEGEPFTLWTMDWVYFPTEYDGAEGVARAPRNPIELAMDHV